MTEVDRANVLIEAFNEFDTKAMRKENNMGIQKSFYNTNKSTKKEKINTRPDELNDYYLTAIKAKLEFLDGIK